jgi:hypothetical protein
MSVPSTKSMVMSAMAYLAVERSTAGRDAQHLCLDRGDHAAFDLLGRHAGRLEDDLHLGLRDVGIGIDRQAEESQVPRIATASASPSTSRR